jgi:hypothetical protein
MRAGTGSRPGVAWWTASAVCISILLSTVALAILGRHERGLDAALMLTGRWSFLLFWSAYAGTGMAALIGGSFGMLGRHGRELGLAFAATMLVHVGLIGWLCAIGAAPATGVFVFFGIGLFCIYTLALFSLSGLQRRIGPRSWWLLRTVAMNYIAYAFATDFLSDPLNGSLRHIVLYTPFALLSVLGFAIYAMGQLVSVSRSVGLSANSSDLRC